MCLIAGFKYWIGKLVRILLLLLFIGYYGGITLFPHSHIVNGITIVHSHPFRSDKGGDSSKLPHSDKELMLIQLLSGFLTTVFAIWIFESILRLLLQKIKVYSTTDGYAESGGDCNYSLRAPPVEM